MPSKFFGFAGLRLKPAPRTLDFGGVPFEVEPPVEPKQFFAFTVGESGAPVAYAYDDTEEGRTALARHCRGAAIEAIVYGVPVEVDRGDIVHVSVGDDTVIRDISPL